MRTYHMRRQDRAIKEESEIRAVLMRGKYAVLGLCRGNEPYAVTLSYGYDAERNALYFHCAAAGLKLDFIRANPDVCATVVEDLGYRPGKCEHAYRSVVIRGKMTIIEDPAEKQRAVDILLRHLEGDPGKAREQQKVTEEAVARTGFLRLDIRELTGKQYE